MEGFPGVQQQDKTNVDSRFQVLAAVDFPRMGRKKSDWHPAAPPLCPPSTGLCPADYFWQNLGGQPTQEHPSGCGDHCGGRLQNLAI